MQYSRVLSRLTNTVLAVTLLAEAGLLTCSFDAWAQKTPAAAATKNHAQDVVDYHRRDADFNAKRLEKAIQDCDKATFDRIKALELKTLADAQGAVDIRKKAYQEALQAFDKAVGEALAKGKTTPSNSAGVVMGLDALGKSPAGAHEAIYDQVVETLVGIPGTNAAVLQKVREAAKKLESAAEGYAEMLPLEALIKKLVAQFNGYSFKMVCADPQNTQQSALPPNQTQPPQDGAGAKTTPADLFSSATFADEKTGKPLDGVTMTVIPAADLVSTAVFHDEDFKPNGAGDKLPADTEGQSMGLNPGDKLIFKIPGYEKQEVVVGKGALPLTFGFAQAPLRFVTGRCDDEKAIENIRKSNPGIKLDAEGMTRNALPQNFCQVSFKSYEVSPGAALPGQGGHSVGDGPDAASGSPNQPGGGAPSSSNPQTPPPGQPGWYEPDFDRAALAEDTSFYSSKGAWGQPYDDMWAAKRIGLSPALLAPHAGASVVVAVIDSGVDAAHPELQGQLWQNLKEIPGNGVDDDHNGFVDDIQGWNFVDASNQTNDNNGHGTLVAGIIAARGDDGDGMMGVCPHCRIMPVKVTDFDNTGSSIRLAQAILYAVDNGARVLNLSVGGQGISQIETAAVNYALDKGILVVAAAGNAGGDVKNFSPAALPGVLTVASTDLNDKRAPFSNWGSAVDIAAPGIDILSLRAGNTDFLQLDNRQYPREAAVVGVDMRYYRTSGSSFSAPFVSGAAGRILSEVNPGLTGEQLRRMLVLSAKDIEAPGPDQYTGYGLLDMAAALKANPDEFVVASIDTLRTVKSANGVLLEVFGTADANRFKSAWVEYAPQNKSADWKRVPAAINRSVKNNRLVSIPVSQLSGSDRWTVRLMVEHENGKRQEYRYRMTLR